MARYQKQCRNNWSILKSFVILLIQQKVLVIVQWLTKYLASILHAGFYKMHTPKDGYAMQCILKLDSQWLNEDRIGVLSKILIFIFCRWSDDGLLMGVKTENIWLEMMKMSQCVNKNSRICNFAEIECHFRHNISKFDRKTFKESEI